MGDFVRFGYDDDNRCEYIRREDILAFRPLTVSMPLEDEKTGRVSSTEYEVIEIFLKDSIKEIYGYKRIVVYDDMDFLKCLVKVKSAARKECNNEYIRECCSFKNEWGLTSTFFDSKSELIKRLNE